MIPFLTAKWKNLIAVNWEVDPALLIPYLPEGTELDSFEGKTFVSLVGFHFLKNKILGFLPTFPAHSFEEINLRFYIRRTEQGEVRRAVCFISEIVPSGIIAWGARNFYNEPYEKRRMFQECTKFDSVTGGLLTYGFYAKDEKLQISVSTQGELIEMSKNSIQEFILEHYWGYTAQKNGSTIEYEVKHRPWKFWDASSVEIAEGIKSFYGDRFQTFLSRPPASIFVADGSDVKLFWGRRIGRAINLNRDKSAKPLGWVLYDGACGFCSWWIPYWKQAIRRCGYEIASVQSKWVQEQVKIPNEPLNNDIRLLLRNGKLINGADAYIYGMQRVWWSRPLGYVLGLPGFRWLTWKFYKIFNRNRFLVSKICRLPPESGS